MSIRDDILRNEETLSHLDQDLYPSLKKLFQKTKIIQHLNGIMGHMMSYTFAMWPEVNRRYYLFSTTHLQNWAKENTRIKSSSKTWQGHIIALELMGLIKIIRVTGPSGDEILDSIYTKAVERATANNWKKVISETLWSVPLYTEKMHDHCLSFPLL